MAQFNIIISEYEFVIFPPAYCGMGKALVLLHNHSEAQVYAQKGLDLLPSYRLLPLNWPGTSKHIFECLPHDVEVRREAHGSCDSHVTVMWFAFFFFKG